MEWGLILNCLFNVMCKCEEFKEVFELMIWFFGKFENF